MNNFGKILSLVTISFFFNNINAMNPPDAKQEEAMPKKSGLHRPIKQAPKEFIRIDPLDSDLLVDEYGRPYFEAKQSNQTIASKAPSTPPIQA